MDVAWFTDTWLPNRDGVVTSLLSFKKVMEERGHNVYVFSPGLKNGEENGIFYYRAFKFPPYPQYRFPSPFSVFSRRSPSIIRKIGANIIHSHSPGVMGLHARVSSSKTKIPMVFTFHTFIDDSVYLLFKNERMQNISRNFIYKWLRWYTRQCKCIIVPSNYVKKRLEKIVGGKEFEIIPTGIDIEKFRKGDEKRARERYENKKIILHVGRVVKEKNIELLIKAAPHILKEVDAVFMIVGEGPHRKNLEEMVGKMGISPHFVFTGFVEDDILLDYYRAADVFAFPSLYETQGLVALEAMAAGVPVVASRAKAIPDFIKDGENGYLVNPYDASEFAQKILEAMDDKEVIKRAKKFVEEYAIERMAERLMKTYEKYGD